MTSLGGWPSHSARNWGGLGGHRLEIRGEGRESRFGLAACAQGTDCYVTARDSFGDDQGGEVGLGAAAEADDDLVAAAQEIAGGGEIAGVVGIAAFARQDQLGLVIGAVVPEGEAIRISQNAEFARDEASRHGRSSRVFGCGDVWFFAA